MTNTNAIIAAIAKGEERVNVLTHTTALGTSAEVKNVLMALVGKGVLQVYDDGRKVRMA